MQITRDVVSDLWPIYASGEASEATKKLVDDFLQTDQEFAMLLKKLSSAPNSRLGAASDDAARELGAVRRTRKAIGTREWLFGAAIFLSLCPFTAYHTSWGSGWVLRDHPMIAAGIAVIAIGLWIAYFRLRQRLGSTQW